MDPVIDKAWMGLLSQRSRLLRLTTPLPDALQVERLRGREAVCEGFVFHIDAISTSAFVDLDALVGREVSLSLARADARTHVWHGIVDEALRVGSDGGLARYRLRMVPWTTWLMHRRNSLVFQDVTALDVLERVFADHAVANARFDIGRTLRTRAVCTQYRETDWAFVTRLMAEEGLGWRFEHLDEGRRDGEAESPQARHRLVVFDDQAQAPQGDPSQVRFHRVDATEDEDAIDVFAERRQIVPAVATTASWDHRTLRARAGSAGQGRGVCAGLEVFDVPGARRHDDDAAAEGLAALRLAALQLPASLFDGAGSLRGLCAGQTVTLTGHARHEGLTFNPLVVEHEAANNLGTDLSVLLRASDIERGTYRNRFVAAPADTPVVPLPRPRPTAPGPQTAKVVGHPDEALTSDRDHQVRIQFAWQRGEAPWPGGLHDAASTAQPDGHAPGDARSGTWVRVAEAVAGPNWGTHFIPRVGSEVLVEFEHGDIDRPVVVGQLFNGQLPPPFPAGEGSDANHAGVLSGWRTRGTDGRHAQTWLVDDTTGQLRQQLDTELTDSRLQLGHLIDQEGNRRGPCRGSGFELHTAAWGRVHADAGLLLSTTLQPEGRGQQMDMHDALGQVRAAGDLGERVTGAGSARGARHGRADSAIQALLDHTDADAGALHAADDTVAAFTEPQLVAEAPTDIALAAEGTLAAFAGEHLHATTQDDLHLSAAHTVALASGEGGDLVAHGGPLRVVATHGPVSLQANTGALKVLADKDVQVTSTDASVEVLARQRIELRVGNSAVVLDGADVTFACVGQFVAKGALQPFGGGRAGAAGALDSASARFLATAAVGGAGMGADSHPAQAMYAAQTVTADTETAGAGQPAPPEEGEEAVSRCSLCDRDDRTLVTVDMLRAIFPRAPEARLTLVVEGVNENLFEGRLDSEERLTHFFAQVRQEIGESMAFRENLRYSFRGLINSTFAYYRGNSERAERDAGNEEAIANNAYADINRSPRFRLGNTEPGDGWRYRGRGLKQTTGRANYRDFTVTHHRIWGEQVDFESNPDLLDEPTYAVRSALAFWLDHSLYQVADGGVTHPVVNEISRAINGGMNEDGYRLRREHADRFWSQRIFRDVCFVERCPNLVRPRANTEGVR